MPDTRSDNALRARAKDGNADAVDELVRRHRADEGRPLWREPSVVRLRTADQLVGAVVDVVVDTHRDGENTTTRRGRLVSAAVGGTSGAIVLRFPDDANRRDVLIELARVRRIERAVISPAAAATYPR